MTSAMDVASIAASQRKEAVGPGGKSFALLRSTKNSRRTLTTIRRACHAAGARVC